MIQKITGTFLIFSLAICFFSCTGEESAQSADEIAEIELPTSGIEIENIWARPGRIDGVSAIYMNILNGAPQADTLISLSSPVAGMTEVHETYEQEEGMMGMRPAKSVIVPGRGTLSLKQGGLHVMLMQLNREFTEGDSIEFTLRFANAGEKILTVPVQSMSR